MIHTVLTIAGSDPSGGAGIQADLKTFASLNVYGMGVIAALTAQNTLGVRDVLAIPPEFVGAELDAVMSDIVPGAIKTGMLGTGVVAEVIAQRLRKYSVEKLVVDPVLVSSSGTHLLDHAGESILKQKLLPLALVATPNLTEAGVLTGVDVIDATSMEEAARRLHRMGARNVLVKGGHLDGDAALDVFFDGTRTERLTSAKIPTKDTHGTGCVLSAAIAAHLALGDTVFDAVVKGKAFVTEAIRTALRLGKGAGPVNTGLRE